MLSHAARGNTVPILRNHLRVHQTCLSSLPSDIDIDTGVVIGRWSCLLPPAGCFHNAPAQQQNFGDPPLVFSPHHHQSDTLTSRFHHRPSSCRRFEVQGVGLEILVVPSSRFLVVRARYTPAAPFSAPLCSAPLRSALLYSDLLRDSVEQCPT